MANLNLNGERLIRLPLVDSKPNYLAGFWQWVELLANDNYQRALEALHWPKGTSWTPEQMKSRITTFYGGDAPWSVVVPNERLVGVINDDAQFQPRNQDGWGWFMAQVPVTTEPADRKNDEIPLMGVASSFFVRQHGGHYVLEFEIFHL
ncbi:MAG TPA: hypothetical protein VFG68_08600 [Fimbriiglobus sp.]|nr:hypothetical protein [Fimbriiglobus sp.]